MEPEGSPMRQGLNSMEQKNTDILILTEDEQTLCKDLLTKFGMLNITSQVTGKRRKYISHQDHRIGWLIEDWLTEPAKGLALLPEG